MTVLLDVHCAVSVVPARIGGGGQTPGEKPDSRRPGRLLLWSLGH